MTRRAEASSTAITAAMTAFHLDLEREMNALGLVCAGCGECCHFDVVDHVLFASALERRHLLDNAERPLRPDAPPDLLAAGKRCPYQAGGKCRARDARPLGCRLYYCASWPGLAAEYEFSERWHRRLKDLHDALGVGWEYGPLLPLPV